MAATKKTQSTKSTTKTRQTVTSVSDMETAETNVLSAAANVTTTQEIPETESPIVSYKAKKAIPMDAMVMVRSAVNGKLIYVSKRTRGYTEVWTALGEEIPMEMAELYSMKNTDRAFFTENWIEVDPIVLRDLQMERFYTDAISVSDLDNIFTLSGAELERKIDSMKENTRNAFALEAIRRVEEGILTDFRTISTIEKKLDCELYEH